MVHAPRRSTLKIDSVAHRPLDRADQRVEREHVEFLDPVRGLTRHNKSGVALGAEFPATFAEEQRDMEALVPCRFDRVDDVDRVPRGGHRDQHIVLVPESFDPSAEDLIETVIIRSAGDVTRISADNRGNGWTVLSVSPSEFFAEVDRVGARAAVADREDLATVLHALCDHTREVSDLDRVVFISSKRGCEPSGIDKLPTNHLRVIAGTGTGGGL